jgi:hypothetical protein
MMVSGSIGDDQGLSNEQNNFCVPPEFPPGDRTCAGRRKTRLQRHREHIGPKIFRYRLPLGSFLDPAVDVKTGETFPGNYHFNPFTGSPLSKPAGAKAAPTKSK